MPIAAPLSFEPVDNQGVFYRFLLRPLRMAGEKAEFLQESIEPDVHGFTKRHSEQSWSGTQVRDRRGHLDEDPNIP